MAVNTGMFLLDRTKARYFTCCGGMHVKIALLTIIILTVFAEILEACAYIFVEGADISSFWELLMETVEYIVTLTLILAFIKEWAIMLIPFIGQTLVVVTIMLINTIRIVYCIIFPYSTFAQDILVDRHLTWWQREQRLLFVLAIMAMITTFVGWCLQVSLTCYQYFEDRTAERKTKESRPPVDQRPPLVQQTQSFGNPNFSIEDPDDQVFESKTRNPAELV